MKTCQSTAGIRAALVSPRGMVSRASLDTCKGRLRPPGEAKGPVLETLPQVLSSCHWGWEGGMHTCSPLPEAETDDLKLEEARGWGQGVS